MSNLITKRIIEEIAESIDIPDSSYETAERRYKDLSKWFGRPEARCSIFDPHLYAQGSFRLGTVIRPIDANGEYDLDMGCRLRTGITKASHTQRQLKHLVGDDLEDYRVARGIEEEREERRRCWRLKYADTLKFHLDMVPSIPEEAPRRQMIKEAMVMSGSADTLAQAVADMAGAITDNTLKSYPVISDDWRISNSEGYALWFESRMELAKILLEKWAIAAKEARLDKLPLFKRKSPLQRCVQILKRHRDAMFINDPKEKPTSVIITMLAGAAYQGEADIDDALNRILTDMGSLVRQTKPRVPNPVNPNEDFADKWYDPANRHLNLEQNFLNWLEQAKADFLAIGNARNAELIVEQASERFTVKLNADDLQKRLGLEAINIDATPKHHVIAATPPKPWRRA